MTAFAPYKHAIKTIDGLGTTPDTITGPAGIALNDALIAVADALDGVASSGDLASKADASALTAHTSATNNPHSVTKAQLSLGNVTNDAQLKAASNLSDLANAGTARTNLGLGSASTQSSSAFDVSGAAAAAVSAIPHADSSHTGLLTAADWNSFSAGTGGGSGLQPANNLSDLASASTARTNLGLGSSATHASTDFDASGAASAVSTSLSASKADKVSGTAGNVATLDGSGNLVDGGVSLASKANASTVSSHISSTSNPHSVTASQVGLGPTSSPTFATVTATAFVGDGSGLTGISSGGGGSSYAADIGDGSTTDIVVTHSLGTRDVSVTVRRNSGAYDLVYPTVGMTTVDSVTLTFNEAPTSGQFRVIIKA